MAADLCRFLEWDSAFFQQRIAALNVPRLPPEIVRDALAWCDAEHIDCLYFLADSDDSMTGRLAHEAGFQFVDARVTLELKLPLHPSTLSSTQAGQRGEDLLPKLAPRPEGEGTGVRIFALRPFAPADLPALKKIARVSYTDSRFYFDSHFPREKCDQLYERWIEKSCADGAEQVIVAEADRQTVGYITCHLKGDTGEIGLLGVSEAARGSGIGVALIRASLNWFGEHDASLVSVVTQARNVGAQRAYQRAGFLTRSVQVWYHRWFERASS
jgi:dTDP-4-amino-4,6-dideoxy-D-galactose acyltransferase